MGQSAPQNALQLIQGYYSYLLLSMYTDNMMKKGGLPLAPDELILHMTSQNSIKINTKRINTLLKQIQHAPHARNVYGYLSYISGIKGVFGVFLDVHSRSMPRRKYLQKILGKDYESYMALVRFCRNLLTHQHTTDITLSQRDISSAIQKLEILGKRIISITFHYKDIFGSARTGSSSYGFHCSINTATLHAKRTLFSVVDEHTLFMLSESIYNLVDHYLSSLETA